MSTTRTLASTPRHDGRHCGHISRSDSPTVKRAAILAECIATVEGFTLTPGAESVAVLAVVDAILSGAPCDSLAPLVSVVEWHADATVWADLHGEDWLTLPTDGGLSVLLPLMGR